MENCTKISKPKLDTRYLALREENCTKIIKQKSDTRYLALREEYCTKISKQKSDTRHLDLREEDCIADPQAKINAMGNYTACNFGYAMCWIIVPRLLKNW